MEKRMDLKDNLPSIQLFLKLFGLELELKNIVEENDILKIKQNETEMGTVSFQKEEIIINSLSMYGTLLCKVNYANLFAMKDQECSNGIYANWTHTFTFSLKSFHNCLLTGNIYFHAKIDNEFGNFVKPRGNLQYIDHEKVYDIRFFENGCPFLFHLQRDTLKEVIKYSLYDGCDRNSYIQYWKFDQFKDVNESYQYYESISLTDSQNANNSLCVILHKEMNDTTIIRNCKEFQKTSMESDSVDAVIQKATIINDNHPMIKQQIRNLIHEFSINNHSFLEQLFLYCFHHYSKEELHALFGIEKGDFDLDQFYFDSSSLSQKILTLCKKENI